MEALWEQGMFLSYPLLREHCLAERHSNIYGINDLNVYLEIINTSNAPILFLYVTLYII
jgi:hypothetical protein